MRFQFELRALADVAPWGDPAGGQQLHWFGLTDGWYDVVLDNCRLFDVVGGDPRGVDYHVVRLWEDLIAVAPFALNEVPAPLAARVARDDWYAWVARAWESDQDELVDRALTWWGQRQVDTGHLRGAPRLDVWCDQRGLHMRWHSLARQADEPVWRSPRGAVVVGARELHDELIRFDRDLMQQMKERIDAIASGWTRAEITIDVDDLQREHSDRSTWLQRALDSGAHEEDWSGVVAAVEELERQIGSPDLWPR